MKLEVVVIPVADVDLGLKRFYGGLGWRLDADFVLGDDFRVVQFTPPGSPCSIHSARRHRGGTGIGTEPGQSESLPYRRGRAELIAHGTRR